MTNIWESPDYVKLWALETNSGNPLRDDQIEVILQLASVIAPKSILDLGCGPGLVSHKLLKVFSNSTLIGIDSSNECIKVASGHLRSFGNRYRLIKGCLQDNLTELSNTKFDLVIAIQSIHHIPPKAKKQLFRWVATHLNSSGLFILSDRVNFSHVENFPYYMEMENLAREARGIKPFSNSYGLDEYFKARRIVSDLPDSVNLQLQWMEEAHFLAECIWKFGFRAILIGKPNIPE